MAILLGMPDGLPAYATWPSLDGANSRGVDGRRHIVRPDYLSDQVPANTRHVIKGFNVSA